MAEPSEQIKASKDVGWLDVAIVLVKRKKIVLGLPVLAVILAVGISYLIPNTYTGTARILPPQLGQSSAAALLNQLGGVAGIATGTNLGLKNPSDVFVAMLK